MSCSQCQGINEVFGEDYVGRQLRRYREKGADKTTRMLSDALASEGVSGLELLDIGGGLGAVQPDLLAAGRRMPPMWRQPMPITGRRKKKRHGAGWSKR